jgi:RHS repeat-associated protein
MGNTVSAEPVAINGPMPFTGSTMQFDNGFKQQTVTDYRAGGLSFTRFYRSNSTWTSTMGALWRHNYARALTVVPGTSASITDGTGVTNAYTWSSGTSTWVPTDPSTRATLQTVTGGWVYTLPNNTVEKYNSSEQLYRIEYFGGGALNLTYNGSGQLTGVANENGRSLSLTYDGSGRVSTLVTPDGTFTYTYGTNNNLTTVTKPDTKTKQYGYTNATYVNALTGVTNEKGNQILTATYDAVSANVVSTQGNSGVSNYGVTYNSDYTSTGTNPLGKAFTYHYVNNNWFPNVDIRRIVQVDGAATTNTPASSEYYNYDYLGRVIGHTDSLNNVTRYAYDTRGNVTQIMEGVYSAQQRLTKITYNATWNVPSLITQPGKTTAFAYDTYGRVTSVTVTDTATSATRVTSYSYYSNSTDGSGNLILGRLQTITGPRTDLSETTTYAYDSNFNLTTITNALSQVTTITARDSAGRPTKITDPNSVETDLTYDTNGRLQTTVRAAGTALAATTTFTYDDDGDLTKVTLPNGVYISYGYDNAQRLTSITDALGNTETYTLDNAGNVTQVVYKNTTPTTTYTHSKTFDELSRLLHSIGASRQTAVFAYDTDSHLTSFTDPNTNPTTYAYDALTRVSKITNALSGVTTPGYNALNQLTSVKDQRNNTTTYTYNAFGDVTGETSPDRGSISYTVDKAGNVTQRTDARSVVTNYTYDAINRLASVAYPSDSTLNVSLTYDSSTGCGTPYIGHLCSVTDAAGTTAYQYDVLSRVTQEKDTRGSLNFTTSYSYDLAGNITGLTLPSGRTVTYTLDSDGRVSGVSATVNGTATTLASSITYLPFGPMNALTYGNSLTFSGTFDQDYNPTNRTVSGSIYNWTYTTDSNGNIKQAGSTTYGYDALNRINTENPGTSVSYTYDATSNRLTKGSTTTTVPSTSNKISAVGSNSYTYDASGDVTGDGVNTYTWNAEGELGIVKVGGTTVGTYTYNLYRERAKKVASSTTYYVYGPGGLLYGEYDTSGNFIREYVYLNGSPLAQIDAGSPEVLTYLHTDHLGTPRFGTSASGSQVWSWNNDAFGTSAPSGSATVNLRMPGQYYDAESGLFYNWNRIYNPAIGRYISSDPVGLVGGLNTYIYVSQNPALLFDMVGLDQMLKYITTGGGQDLAYWQRQWVLTEPTNGGLIVQTVTGHFQAQDSSGNSEDESYQFREAWVVPPTPIGVCSAEEANAPYDQFDINNPDDTTGDASLTATAVFYEGATLPDDFQVQPQTNGGNSGSLPRSDADPSQDSPQLPSNGTAPVTVTWKTQW